MERKTLLEVRDLCKYFKTPNGMLHAVDMVNFSVCEYASETCFQVNPKLIEAKPGHYAACHNLRNL